MKYLSIIIIIVILSSCQETIKQNNSNLLPEDIGNSTLDSIFEYSDSNLVTESEDFLKPTDFTPMSFLKYFVTDDNAKKSDFRIVTMENSFPEDWINEKKIDSLILFVNSKQKCACFANPLSSKLLPGYAEVGGYASKFILSYINHQKIDFGLFSCPQTNQKDSTIISNWAKSNNKVWNTTQKSPKIIKKNQ